MDEDEDEDERRGKGRARDSKRRIEDRIVRTIG